MRENKVWFIPLKLLAFGKQKFNTLIQVPIQVIPPNIRVITQLNDVEKKKTLFGRRRHKRVLFGRISTEIDIFLKYT